MKRVDSIYCGTAAFVTVALVISGMVRAGFPSHAANMAVALTVCFTIGHFIAGVVIQIAMRRFLRPASVVLCALATGTFSAAWFYAVVIHPR